MADNRPMQQAVFPSMPSASAVYWALLRRITVWAACVDVGFLLLYGALGATALAAMNLASVAIYTAAWWLLHLRRNTAAIALIWLEVLAHASAGSLLLGWQADFHLFLLLFVPAIVFGAPRRRSVPLLLLLLASYAGLYLACKAFAPLSPLPPGQLELARWFNIIMVFGLFFAVSSFYRQRVRRAERTLQQLARIDALTQLANRTHFQEHAAREIVRARREGQPLTLMLADIDHFKQVNDGHGHDAGDHVLAEVARAMAGALREHDLLARWGGEEFLALLPATDGALARSVAERVRATVAGQPLVVRGRPIAITLSFGLAALDDGDLQTATRLADLALYASKRHGRNRVTHADDLRPEPPAPPSAAIGPAAGPMPEAPGTGGPSAGTGRLSHAAASAPAPPARGGPPLPA